MRGSIEWTLALKANLPHEVLSLTNAQSKARSGNSRGFGSGPGVFVVLVLGFGEAGLWSRAKLGWIEELHPLNPKP